MKAALANLKEIRIYDIRRETAEKCSQNVKEKTGLDAKIMGKPRDAVEGADIIVTVTVADEPIVKNDWVKKGSFFSHRILPRRGMRGRQKLK